MSRSSSTAGRDRRRRSGPAAAALLAASAGASQAGVIELSIDGTEGSRFRGECRVGVAEQVQVLPLEGPVPLRRHLQGDSISCTIEQLNEGALEVVIRKGGNTSRSRSKGPNSRINLRVR